MAGISWDTNKKETEHLHKLVEKEKVRAKKIGVRMNWDRVSKKLNEEFNNKRTPKGCFWRYQRTKIKKVKEKKEPVRTPRPKRPNTYDKVKNPEEYWITASDDEGNVIVSLLVKNTAANVSRMLTESAMRLDELKDNS